MAITSGFFNSVSNDRKYYASQFGEMFNGLIKDGVFETVGKGMLVAPVSGLSVKVQSGRAWFDGTWTSIVGDESLTCAAANTVHPRIDTVVLEVNKDVNTRANSVKIIQGTPATNPLRPVLTNTESIKQYPLADIRVAANATDLTQSSIVNRVGTADCPWVTGATTTINASDLYAQWDGEFQDFIDGLWVPESQDEYTEVMMHLAALTDVRVVEFLASGWTETSSGSNVYSQTVAVNTMSADYNPTLLSWLSYGQASSQTPFSVAEVNNYNKDFSIIASGTGVTATGSITWYCYGKRPTQNCKVILKGE